MNIDDLGMFIACRTAIAGAAAITALAGLGPWTGVAIMCASLLLHWKSKP